MLIASFLAGNVPLSFHLSEDRLKLISNFGVGLLVGTSLVVIIPEGVETLYSTPKPANGEGEEEEEEDDAHKYIGLALLSGFILMFLIDQMGPTHAHSHNNHVSVADFTELHNLQLDDNNIRMPSAAGMNAGGGKKRGNPITIGLVVHAAADGIALGASASRPELRFIVFLAIMLHKAPAAFGLSTVLLQHGFSRRQTRQQVGIFALAAPIGALLTYIFIQLSGHREEASLHWWTGMLLLFSGGTFLYVAMHVMSEMNNTEKSSGSNGYSVGGAGGDKGLSVVDVLCVIGGMVVPLILSVDHEH
ncbi:Zinc/iron permease [Linnemannia elongata AG-77]|uniref:Zinc/iron permease n=1 Tax=Linnemannia elongata AG-77 TaxID=1314771 RepID=A0A197JCJ9_9FUNG|nr:Zinc/iron permease [Linnemannia elongata AG-77]